MEGELDIDQYRQKWEAEPHWNIKKEFLEKYKHDFPKTRLLCLAQAYVNVELLGCSYPVSVMTQIQELSRCLRRSKNFIGGGSSSDGGTTQGKRPAPSSDSSITNKIMKTETRNTTKTGGMQNIESAADSVVTNHTIDMDQASHLLEILYSENYDLIFKTAKTFRDIKGLSNSKKRNNALNIIQDVARSLACEHLIRFHFEGDKKEYCKFFIGDTLLSFGWGEDESKSKKVAVNNCYNYLRTFRELPHKSAENLMNELVTFLRSDSNAVEKIKQKAPLNIHPDWGAHDFRTKSFTLRDFRLLYAFAKCATTGPLKGLPDSVILGKSQQCKKIIHYQYFHHLDMINKTPSITVCHLVINNILVSTQSDAKKNYARVGSAKGYRYLFDILKYVDNANSLPPQPSSVMPMNRAPMHVGHCNDVEKEIPSENVLERRTSSEKEVSSEYSVTNKIMETEARNTGKTGGIQNIQIAGDSVVTNHTIDIDQASHLLEIVYSENYDLIFKIAKTFNKDMKRVKNTKKKNDALNVIQDVARSLACEHLIRFRFEGDKKEYCKFFIGDTLLSFGCGEDESKSKTAAVNSGYDYLKNFCSLPHKSAENLMNELVTFLRSDSDAVEKIKQKAKLNINSVSGAHDLRTKSFTLRDFRLLYAFAKLATTSPVKDLPDKVILGKCEYHHKIIHYHYFSHPDVINKSPSITVGHLVINNILVSSQSDAKKNKAKAGSTKGYRYLFDILKYVDNVNSLPPQPSSVVSMNRAPMHVGHYNDASENMLERRTSSENKLNTDLLRGTYKMKFALFDRSKIARMAHITMPLDILYYSASQSRARLICNEEMDESSCRCTIYINDIMISSENALCKKEAKLKAANSALEKLKGLVCTIQEKEHSSTITHQQVDYAESISQCISSSNVGHQMLQKMGWKGGAIQGQGIVEPVMAEQRRFGEGLGFGSGIQSIHQLKSKIESLLKDYQNSDTISDLVFTAEFSKEERKIIHEVALRYGLISVSHGQEPYRQLHVKRKLTLDVLLRLLVSRNGITEKYDIVPVI